MSALVALVAIITMAGVAYYVVERLQAEDNANTVIDVQLPKSDTN